MPTQGCGTGQPEAAAAGLLQQALHSHVSLTQSEDMQELHLIALTSTALLPDVFDLQRVLSSAM
jgi:hypothetical protein